MPAPRTRAEYGAPWTLERLYPDSFVIHFDMAKAREAWVLLMSDEHVDNQHCDRDLLTKHHKEALEKNAPILKFGDTFCAMQGKWDKRADQDELRPEHRGNRYLDSLVATTADYYRPFSSQIALITPGNHEGSILKRHQTDLVQRLAERLRSHGSPVEVGSYRGFCRFRFNSYTHQMSRVLCWHHGYGGGGEVTRGLIDNSRTRGQYFADYFYSGHIHRRNEDENVITYVNEAGRVERKEQLFLRGGAYKHDDEGAWHVGRGGAARPLGGWWLRFQHEVNGGDRRLTVASIRAV